MNTFLAQLKQWPPTSSTIYGAAILFALVSYIVTGSWEAAVAVLGFVKLLCPQDAPAINKALQEAQAMQREVATAPKA